MPVMHAHTDISRIVEEHDDFEGTADAAVMPTPGQRYSSASGRAPSLRGVHLVDEYAHADADGARSRRVVGS